MFKVEIDSAEVQTFLSQLPNDMHSRAEKAFRDNSVKTHAKILSNVTTNLNVRSGDLRDSFSFSVMGTTLGTLVAVHESDSIYAMTHEKGATITAKNKYTGVPGGPYLNIPTDVNQTSSGIMKMSPGQVFSSGGYVAKRGVYLNGVMMFSLVKSVEIPARLKLESAIEDSTPTLLGALSDMFGGM